MSIVTIDSWELDFVLENVSIPTMIAGVVEVIVTEAINRTKGYK